MKVRLGVYLAVLVLSPLAASADESDDAYKNFDNAFSAEQPGAPQVPSAVATPPESSKPTGFSQSLKLEGQLKNETAYRLRSDPQLSKVRNQALLVQSGALGSEIQFRATERAYYDAVFDLTDNYPENVADDLDHRIDVRDTYLDYSHGDIDIRIGKQQIVWGEAVALFFADVVNAKDLREFVLPDFDMIRIPEWGADVDYSKGDFHLEFVYIPFPEVDQLPQQGSDYAFVVPVPDGVPYSLRDAEEPSNAADNSEYGTRVSYLTNGWDLGAFYLYTWDKFPVFFRSFDAGGQVIIDPAFRRQHIAGLTFSKEVAPVVWKGEFVLRPNSSFSTSDLNDTDGVVRKTFLDYTLGADVKVLDSIDTNFQFLQRMIFDGEDSLIGNSDKVRNYCSFWAKTSYFGGKVEPEFLLLSSFMRVDLMIRPSVRWKFAERWDVKMGVDWFEGKKDELLGEFENGSRGYMELTYRL